MRIGIGGWTYAPWRGGVFYPGGHSQKRELEYASRAVTAIEINGTYYSTFKPASFAKWASEVPDDFVFAVKASRYATNRKRLDEGGESIARFLGQGLSELGPKLGPILWQLASTKTFDPGEISGFFDQLARAGQGMNLRHAIHVRHESFHLPEFIAMCRAANIAIVYADSAVYPAIADISADFIYARLENAQSRFVAGYPPAALDRWAERLKCWESGRAPDDLPRIGASMLEKPRDVFALPL